MKNYDNFNLERRRFVTGSCGLILGAVTIVISGCGSEFTVRSWQVRENGDLEGVVSRNHGHRAIITASQLEDGAAVRIDIRGDSPHLHLVDLSEDDVSAIGRGETVTRTSTRDAGHTHDVTFNP
jgi:hypothetical protein